MNKRALVASCLLLSTVVGVSTALAVDTSLPERRRWNQFCEEKTVAMPGQFSEAFEAFNSRIKLLGSEGWELSGVTVSDHHIAACFKREMK